MDLPTAGERLIVDPILRHGRFIVPTSIPSADPCAVGGYSWLMELDYLGGGRLLTPTFDVNLDGVVNNTDVVAFSSTQVPAGVRLDAISSTPSVVRGFGSDDNPQEMLYMNTSNGSTDQKGNRGEPLALRRSSWRQVF
jgi:type IV pilus assembly protein PilY1